MKTLLLLINLMIVGAFSSSGQGLVILDKDNNDVTNDTIVVSGYSDEGLIKAKIFLKNDSDTDFQVWVKKIEDDLLAGAFATFCWNSSCFPPTVFEAEEPMTLLAGETSTEDDFYSEYGPEGQVGTSFVSFEFYNRDNSFETVKVAIKFVTESPTSSYFDEPRVVLSSPRPNPAVNFTSFDFSIPADVNNASLIIRDLTGRIVIDQPVSVGDNAIRLNVSDLNNGIFLYSLVLEGKPVITRKLVVSH